MEDKNIYVTSRGRKVKRKYYNTSFKLDRVAKRSKMANTGDNTASNQLMAMQQDLERQRQDIQSQQAVLQQQRAALDQEKVALQRAQMFEVQQLRTQLEQAQLQINQSQSRNDQHRPETAQVQNNANGQPAANVSTNEICNVVSAMTGNQFDVKMPTFSNEIERNPQEFIEELEKFFRIKNIKENKKISGVESALMGKAQYWFHLQDNFASYNEFKNAFITEFYSIPTQVKVKSAWASRRYQSQDGNFQTYYYQQLKESNYILPKLSEFEKNYTVAQQFPSWVRQSLASCDFQNSNSIAQTLAYIDVIRDEKYRERKQFHDQTPRKVQVRQVQIQDSQVNNNRYNRNRNQYNQNGRGRHNRYINRTNPQSVPNNNRATHFNNSTPQFIPQDNQYNNPCNINNRDHYYQQPTMSNNTRFENNHQNGRNEMQNISDRHSIRHNEGASNSQNIIGENRTYNNQNNLNGQQAR